MSWVSIAEVVIGLVLAALALPVAFENLPWVKRRRQNERIAADHRIAQVLRKELVRPNSGSSVMDRLNMICARLDEGSDNFHSHDKRLVSIETELKVTRGDKS